MKKIDEGLWDKIVSNMGTKQQRAKAWQRRVASGEKKPEDGSVDQSSLVNRSAKGDAARLTVKNKTAAQTQPETGPAQSGPATKPKGDVPKGQSLAKFTQNAQKGQYGKQVTAAANAGKNKEPMKMPDVRARTQPIRDYQAAKSDAAKRSAGMGLYPGGVNRRVGGPTRGSEARADATKTVGQNAQRQREADTMQKIGDKAAKTAGGQVRNNYAQARSNQSQAAAGSKFAAPKPAPNAAQAATSPATPPPHPQAAVAAAVAAKTTKAGASRAALPVSAVKAATKTGGQTVNKGTSKAPIANPKMKQMQQQRVGNWKNAETVSSYRKRMSMKEQRIWNLIESNETEPLKDKVVDKVKKEKKSAGKKGTTEMGGPTDIIDTEPQKTVQVGQQSR